MFLEIIIITALWISFVIRILNRIPIFIGIIRVRTITHELTFVHVNTAISTILEIDIGSYLEPISYFGIQFHIGTNSTIGIINQGAFVTQIAQREVIIHFLRSTADTGIVVLIETQTKGFVLPIHSLAWQNIFKHITCESQTLCPNAQIAFSRFVASITSPNIQINIRQLIGIRIIVIHTFIYTNLVVVPITFCISSVSTFSFPVCIMLQICRRTKSFTVSASLCQTNICADVYYRFTSLSFFSRNDNNTIGCFGTIHSCRRSILQYINLTNIVRIDFRKFAIEHHTI